MRALTLKEMSAVAGGCGANNGWGNGDQNAPGNSLTHNRAENNVRPGANHKGTDAQPLTVDANCQLPPPPPPA